MYLRIHFESSADVNEFGICTSLDNLQAFIKETFDGIKVFIEGECENINLSKERSRFIGANLFVRKIASRNSDERCDSFIEAEDFIAFNEDLYGDYLSCNFDSSLAYYVSNDVIKLRQHTGVYGCFSADIKVVIDTTDVSITIARILENCGIRAFDYIELVLHPAYQQRRVELINWLHDYINEMFGDGSVELKDIGGDKGFIYIGYK